MGMDYSIPIGFLEFYYLVDTTKFVVKVVALLNVKVIKYVLAEEAFNPK